MTWDSGRDGSKETKEQDIAAGHCPALSPTAGPRHWTYTSGMISWDLAPPRALGEVQSQTGSRSAWEPPGTKRQDCGPACRNGHTPGPLGCLTERHTRRGLNDADVLSGGSGGGT